MIQDKKAILPISKRFHDFDKDPK